MLPLDRRRELLELCREHDLLVLEEDPHHLLQYGDQATTPSLLSLDTEGRVLRWVHRHYCDNVFKLLHSTGSIPWRQCSAPALGWDL